jgi:DNA-binding MarR family transcriptional regulator
VTPLQSMLAEASKLGHVAGPEPLSSREEELWRIIMRIVKVMPRQLDADLVKGVGMTASEYTTLMMLSEAPNRELRMSDLASATGLSASRTTRLVDELKSRGLVTKTASSSDARANVTRLTSRGMSKLKAAWPVHLKSARTHFLDHLPPKSVDCVRKGLTRVAEHLGDPPPNA